MGSNMYQVVRVIDKTVVATGFAKREDAKPSRNTFNTGDAMIGNDPSGNAAYVVGRGSDHPNGPSFGPVEQSKRWL